MNSYEDILELRSRGNIRELAIDLAIDKVELPDKNDEEQLWISMYKQFGLQQKRTHFMTMLRFQSEYILRCMQSGMLTIEIPKLGTFYKKKGKVEYHKLEEELGKDNRSEIEAEMLNRRNAGKFLDDRGKKPVITLGDIIIK
jgi:hypothetical protein